MEKIKIDYEIEVKAITKAERSLPKEWSYEKSVKKVKQMVYRWKRITVEILHELWVAHEILAKRYKGKKIDVQNRTSKTWTDFCEEIDIGRSTVHDWLERYDEKGMKIKELEEQKEGVKKEKGEYVEGIKEQVEQIEADIESIKEEIETDADKDSEKIQLVKEEEAFVDMTDEAEEDIRKEIKETRKVISEKKKKYLDANIGLIQCISKLCTVNTTMDDLIKLWPDLKDTAKDNFIVSFNILKGILIKGTKKK